MQNAAVITVACLLLSLTFNYTFPLHRESTRWSPLSYTNHSNICDMTRRHTNIPKLRKKIDTEARELEDKHSPDKHSFSEHDLRQFEQLVIMKKYPYLDHKELQIKFNPSSKNVRQSEKFDSGSSIAGDSGIRESLEDGLNVEIINRGLTGFAIPSKIAQGAKEVADTSSKANVKLNKHVEHEDVLGRFHHDNKGYNERKGYEID